MSYQKYEHNQEPENMLSEFLAGLSIAMAKWIVFGGISVALIYGLCSVTDNTKPALTALKK